MRGFQSLDKSRIIDAVILHPGFLLYNLQNYLLYLFIVIVAIGLGLTYATLKAGCATLSRPTGYGLQAAGPPARLSPLPKIRLEITTLTKRMITSDWVIGGTLLLTLIWIGACSLFAPGWIAASLITGINWLIFVGYSFIHRDKLVARIMLLALVAGWVELLADRWLVDVTQTLVYHPGGPFVLRSPLYMPFAWGAVLIQTGYAGWRMIQLKGRGWAIFLIGMLGVATIPLYEWWANGAMWWFYRNTRVWGVVPVYIILGEFFIAGGLVLLIHRLEERPWWLAPLLGVIQGFWIWACYGVSFGLVG